ncbi:zinc finger protein 62 homolog [Oppia nitens]|uniref:zinc finger protein 62 homolog n=1 Tax=Oppia nitens TaxID=1686743 RepID=UPI0023DAC85F|nr:zinc finger protein 62 homolog [Oppia nitens]
MASRLSVKDVFDELSRENQRLVGELRLCHRFVRLCDQFRQLATDFRDRCICDQNVGNEAKLNDLNSIYESLEVDSREWRTKMTTSTTTTSDQSLRLFTDRLIAATDDNEEEEDVVVKHEDKSMAAAADDSNDWQPMDEQFTPDGGGGNEDTDFKPNIGKIRRRLSTTIKTKNWKSSSTTTTTTIRTSCPTCDKTFGNKKLLKIHQQSHSDQRDYDCPVDGCGKRFKNAGSLYKHRRVTHSDERPFRCQWEGCSRAYKTKDAMLRHRVLHTNDGKHRCDYDGCDKSFKDPSRLEQHRRRHDRTVARVRAKREATGVSGDAHKKIRYRRVQCVWPGCSAHGTKQEMIIHLNRHQGIKPFVCSADPTGGCQMRYYTDWELKQHRIKAHELTNPADRPYRCDYDGCCLAYATQRDLKRHRHRHDRIYRCSWPECDQSYPAKIALKEHMDRHLNVKSHKCHFCGKEFFSKNNFQTHQKNVHQFVAKKI